PSSVRARPSSVSDQRPTRPSGVRRDSRSPSTTASTSRLWVPLSSVARKVGISSAISDGCSGACNREPGTGGPRSYSPGSRGRSPDGRCVRRGADIPCGCGAEDVPVVDQRRTSDQPHHLPLTTYDFRLPTSAFRLPTVLISPASLGWGDDPPIPPECRHTRVLIGS